MANGYEISRSRIKLIVILNEIRFILKTNVVCMLQWTKVTENTRFTNIYIYI